jgi:hypothetical protein
MPPCIWMLVAAALTYVSAQVNAVMGKRGRGMARCGGGRLCLEQQIRGHVLDGLKAADRPAELDARLGIVDRLFQHLASAAHLFAGERHACHIECRGDRRPASAQLADRCGSRCRELQARQAQRGVERWQQLSPHTGGGRGNFEQRQSGSGVGHHQQCLGKMSVRHVVGETVQQPCAVLQLGRDLDRLGRPPPARAGDRKRCDSCTAGDAG